jgi:hypothetical protein
MTDLLYRRLFYRSLMDRIFNTIGKWKNKIFLNQKMGYKNVKIKTLKTILIYLKKNLTKTILKWRSSIVGILKWRSSIVGPQMTVLNCRSSNAGLQVSHHHSKTVTSIWYWWWVFERILSFIDCWILFFNSWIFEFEKK